MWFHFWSHLILLCLEPTYLTDPCRPLTPAVSMCGCTAPLPLSAATLYMEWTQFAFINFTSDCSMVENWNQSTLIARVPVRLLANRRANSFLPWKQDSDSYHLHPQCIYLHGAFILVYVYFPCTHSTTLLVTEVVSSNAWIFQAQLGRWLLLLLFTYTFCTTCILYCGLHYNSSAQGSCIPRSTHTITLQDVVWGRLVWLKPCSLHCWLNGKHSNSSETSADAQWRQISSVIRIV